MDIITAMMATQLENWKSVFVDRSSRRRYIYVVLRVNTDLAQFFFMFMLMKSVGYEYLSSAYLRLHQFPTHSFSLYLYVIYGMDCDFVSEKIVCVYQQMDQFFKRDIFFYYDFN